MGGRIDSNSSIDGAEDAMNGNPKELGESSWSSSEGVE